LRAPANPFIYWGSGHVRKKGGFDVAHTSYTSYTSALDWIAESLMYKCEGLVYAARGLAKHLNDLATVLQANPEAALPIEEIRGLANQVIDQAIAVHTLRGVRMVAQAEADGRSWQP
jgi:hypothetical protein